ncbi:response regulator transcription factor [Streptomyces sp. NPDC097610]|uniref:response regulator transcription factor n=1 Tax=Streptomyces sp. NPDC097610 TaxID=3157227 RepID=UPI0033260D5B
MTILLVDDEPLLRMGLRMVLETYDDMRVIGEVGDGQDAIRCVRELKPDMVLMDVRMPGMDGVETTRRIVASGSRSRVLILTTFDLDEYSYGSLRAGASGFLLKNLPPTDLVSAIRSVHSGDAVLAPSTTRRLLDAYAHRLPTPGAAERPTEPRLDRLTAREYEILLHMAEGLSNSELADRLKLAEPTVKTHVVRILAKLELRDRIQAIIYAYEIGLVRPTNRPPGTA